MERADIRSVFVGVFLAALLAAPASSQTLAYDHVHLYATDPVAAAQWYVVHLGAELGVKATPTASERVLVGNTLLVFARGANEPSAGGAIQHIAVSFPDVPARMSELERAGVKIVAPFDAASTPFPGGFVEDPWGVLIELVQAPGSPGFHHIHLKVPRADDAIAWYSKMFGGDRVGIGEHLDALRYGRLLLVVDESATTLPATGRAIDHLGWSTSNVDELYATLGEKGVSREREPGGSPGGNRVAFVRDPSGVRIELVQRPN